MPPQCHQEPACLATPHLLECLKVNEGFNQKKKLWIVSYPDALVKASASNKPGVRAEFHIIDKLLMSCIVE